MAKNTNSNAFRKIDVDQFSEDNFRDEDGPATTPLDNSGSGVESEKEVEVSNLLSNGQHAEALKICLGNAPIGNKNQDEKVWKKMFEMFWQREGVFCLQFESFLGFSLNLL